ncbi:MAG: helix-turn-helix domain-containing protein [Oscillospiraceae bacterium]|jgi:transcriptional regulator with XRE-family HTH domain|nr:helix-turn-helix domain-containing protein [Oscillospiraceae bacterium]
MAEAHHRNDIRYIKLGLKIAYYRKMNGLTQEQLAERIDINSRYLSLVESPTFVQPISLKVLFAAADVFQIPPYKLLDFEE